MTIIAFIGRPRTGKTLFMTFHAYNNYLNGHEIFSNYKLSFPHTLMSPYDMLKIPFQEVDRDMKTLCIQEATKWFDSRSSLRPENKLLHSLTGQSGKRNLNILWDDQSFERADKALRRATEYIYTCHVPFIDGNTKEPLAFQYNKEDMYDGAYIKLPLIPASVLKPFYSMYNSYEATIPITVGKTMQEMDTLFSGKKKHVRQKTT